MLWANAPNYQVSENASFVCGSTIVCRVLYVISFSPSLGAHASVLPLTWQEAGLGVSQARAPRVCAVNMSQTDPITRRELTPSRTPFCRASIFANDLEQLSGGGTRNLSVALVVLSSCGR